MSFKEQKILLFLLILETAFIVIGNAVHPGCECVVFSSTNGKEKGIFKSPDYPTPYPTDIDCLLYTFIAGPEEIVQIGFDDFNVSRNKIDCLGGDYMKIFQHLDSTNINEYTPWQNVFCGNLVDISTVIYSSGPGLVLEFHSGSRITKSKGFTGYFRFINKRIFRTDGIPLLNSMCDYHFSSLNSNLPYGKFYSPRYPSNYPTNIRCSYKFKAKNNERIRIIFEDMFLQKGDISCLNRPDLIKIFNGKSTLDPVIYLLCNEGNEIEILSTGSDLFVEFIANSVSPGQGFKAKYQFEGASSSKNSIDQANKLKRLGSSSSSSSSINASTFSPNFGPSVSETRFSCDKIFNSDDDKIGTFNSPLYPLPYHFNTTCNYEFHGRGKERIRIIFHDFHLYENSLLVSNNKEQCFNEDQLTVFLKINGRMEKMISLCGSTLPIPIMSSSNKIKLEFISLNNSNNNFRGFNATYIFTEDFSVKTTGIQLLNYPCAFELNSNDSKMGYFHSPNFPGFYPRDTECYYFFRGNLNEKVSLYFFNFNVDGISPCQIESASDYVEFPNFTLKDRKYRRYCGKLDKFNIQSDRQFFKVTFKSNDKLDGTGFNATYKFINIHTKNDEFIISNKVEYLLGRNLHTLLILLITKLFI